MHCALCGNEEVNKLTGKPHRHDSRSEKTKTTAMCCADCCNLLVNLKVREVPWGGKEEMKMILAETKNGPSAEAIKRRRGA